MLILHVPTSLKGMPPSYTSTLYYCELKLLPVAFTPAKKHSIAWNGSLLCSDLKNKNYLMILFKHSRKQWGQNKTIFLHFIGPLKITPEMQHESHILVISGTSDKWQNDMCDKWNKDWAKIGNRCVEWGTSVDC